MLIFWEYKQMDSWGAYPKMHGFGEIRDAP